MSAHHPPITYRYVRSCGVESNQVDRYDLGEYPSSKSHNFTTEYLTNGRTNLLSVLAFSSSEHISTSNQGNSHIMANSSPLDSAASKNILRNSLIAGSVAGMASQAVCYPFDVLRIKMQAGALETAGGGVIRTFKHTVQYGGFQALYKGLAMPLCAQALYKATIFTVNNLTKQAIIDWKTLENHKFGRFNTTYSLTMRDRFFCGVLGGAINGALLVTPVEYIRNRLINDQKSKESTSKHRFKGPLSVIRATIQTDGMSGLWRGMASTVLRDSIGCGFFFLAMSYTQKLLAPYERPSVVVVTSGAMAGIAFWLWALPIDTMKTWIQAGTAKNMRHAFQLAYRKDPLGGLYSLSRGWQVAYGRGAPSAAITVTTYSLVYHFLSDSIE